MADSLIRGHVALSRLSFGSPQASIKACYYVKYFVEFPFCQRKPFFCVDGSHLILGQRHYVSDPDRDLLFHLLEVL